MEIASSRRKFIMAAGAAAVLSACRRSETADSQDPDLIVIGAGGAGLSAAVSAAENGLRVLVLEKEEHIGGSTRISGGFYSCVDPGRQNALGIRDSEPFFLNQVLQSGGGHSDPALARTLVFGATPMLRWLESQGMKFMPSVTEAYGAEWPRAHKPLMPNGEGYIRTLSNRASALGAEIRTGTAAVALLQSDGRVTGVRVNDRGTLRNLNAKKGVILSSGGFGANREMIHRFAPKYDGFTTNAAPGSTGEMILEAEKIGSSLTDMDRILCNPGAPEGRTHHARFHMIVDQFILVNHQGRRFIREDAHRNQLTDAVLKLPERYAYTVIDDRAFRNLSILMQKEATLAIETGDAWCADTVPELASLMGLPKGNLARTVEQYNRSVKTRQDPLGKAASALKSPILKPPFWGCYTGMSTLYTLGGVRISPQARVLTALGKPIPGLWAAGEVTGGVHGVNRLGGCGIPDGLVFGRIAGLDAAGIKS